MPQMKETKERFSVTLPASLKAELERLVPERQRSRFTEQALERALREKAVADALEALDALPSYSTRGEDSVAVLRQGREDLAARAKPSSK